MVIQVLIECVLWAAAREVVIRVSWQAAPVWCPGSRCWLESLTIATTVVQLAVARATDLNKPTQLSGFSKALQL